MADDADLLTVRTDQAHLGDADPVVDPGLGADGASGLSSGWIFSSPGHEKGFRGRAHGSLNTQPAPGRSPASRQRTPSHRAAAARAADRPGPDDLRAQWCRSCGWEEDLRLRTRPPVRARQVGRGQATSRDRGGRNPAITAGAARDDGHARRPRHSAGVRPPGRAPRRGRDLGTAAAATPGSRGRVGPSTTTLSRPSRPGQGSSRALRTGRLRG